mgnify:CR=1 FL=1
MVKIDKVSKFRRSVSAVLSPADAFMSADLHYDVIECFQVDFCKYIILYSNSKCEP